MTRENPEQAEARGAVELSEDALAQAFEMEYLGKVFYDWARQRWHVYDAQTGAWQADRTGLVLHFVRTFVRGLNSRNEAKWAKAAVVASVERLARSRPELARSGDELDADPWLLGTPAGVYDLRTMELLENDPVLLVTKSTAVAPSFSVPTLWLKFLHEATGGDEEVIGYLQRLIGYAFTGSTREEILAFFHGSGQNGKGTFLGTLRDIAGDYGRTAPMDAFLESKGDRHSADLAMLAAIRLAFAQESGDGRRWAEDRIKSVTGRDEQTARHLYGQFFSFKPQFKLLIASNHKPRIRTVDDAWRRRIHLVPFEIKPANPDPLLKEKLADEYPQILAWALEGAEWWYREGLNPPAAITEASKKYFEEEDITGLWFAECADEKAGERTERKDLYSSFHRWCSDMGHRAPTQHALTRWLKQRGFGQDASRTRPILGVALKSQGAFPAYAASTAAAYAGTESCQEEGDHDLPF
jgi:putative DNA primase/helicase